MYAAYIASHGRVARVSGRSLASQGRIYKRIAVAIGAIATYIAKVRGFAFCTRSRPCYAE